MTYRRRNPIPEELSTHKWRSEKRREERVKYARHLWFECRVPMREIAIRLAAEEDWVRAVVSGRLDAEIDWTPKQHFDEATL